MSSPKKQKITYEDGSGFDNNQVKVEDVIDLTDDIITSEKPKNSVAKGSGCVQNVPKREEVVDLTEVTNIPETENITYGDSSPFDENQVKDEESVGHTDYCCVCENEPCLVVDLDGMLMAMLQEYRDDKTHKEIRYLMYTNSIFRLHGRLGKGNRRKLPTCVEDKIRSLAPDDEYKGFVPSQEGTE